MRYFIYPRTPAGQKPLAVITATTMVEAAAMWFAKNAGDICWVRQDGYKKMYIKTREHAVYTYPALFAK
jgi:hypothetical protein